MRMNRPQGLMEEMRAQIESGVLQPGDRLPSYAEMKARHGLAPQTTDRIYSTLERAGLIVRAQGSGTFVAEQMPKDAAAPGSENLLIALVVPAVESVFFSEILSGAETACWDAGFHLLIANTRGSSHREAQYLRSLAQRVAGLCIVPSESASYAAFNALLENEVPFVFVDRALDKLNASLAAADNELLGYMATKHLLELGHREVFVLCEGVASSVAERLRGYKRALDEVGIAFDPKLVRSNAQYMEAAGYSLTQEIVQARRKKTPLALFCINDLIAQGAYVALKERGWSIPRDAAIVAAGNSTQSKTSQSFDPPLTTVHMDLQGMGAAGIKLLIEAIKRGGRAPVRQVRLQPQIKVRNSSDLKSDYSRARNLQKRVDDAWERVAKPGGIARAPVSSPALNSPKGGTQ